MSTVDDAKGPMDAALDALRREFATVRTGKATPALLDSVQVDAYGSKMPINQVGTVSTPEPNMAPKKDQEPTANCIPPLNP